MMSTRSLAKLERIKDTYSGTSAVRKLALLRALDRLRLRTAGQVERLHEVLCFLRAYPDDARVAGQVERMLVRFARRADLQAHRDALADSGIAGTAIHYCFFWPTARWLAQRWPGEFHLDRRDAVAEDNIAGALPMLVTPAEATWLREAQPAGYDALDALRGRVTDATFLARAIESLPGDSFTREALFDGLDPSCELRPLCRRASNLPKRAAAPQPTRSARRDRTAAPGSARAHGARRPAPCRVGARCDDHAPA
jgi:predicted nucleic acid-binding protein